MRILFILLLVCVLLAAPVSATNYQLSALPKSNQEIKMETGITDYTFDAAANQGTAYKPKAIQEIIIDMPSDTTVHFTLTYGSGETVSGWGKYLHTGQTCNDITGNAYCNYNEVSIGGDTHGYNFWGLSEIGHLNIIGYARNMDTNTTGIIVYDDILGLNNPSSSTAYFSTGAATNIIYRVHISSDKPVKLTMYISDKETLQGTVSSTPSEIFNKWVNIATGISSMVQGFITGLIYWIGFFFAGGNWILIVVLYITGSMAITAYNTKGNPVAFLPRFFKDQKALFEFALGVWRTLIESIGTIIGWFRLI